jgi:hypothetical protein
MKNTLIILALFLTQILFTQENSIHKKINIKRVNQSPKIDGLLNDIAWQNASIAKNFVMFTPDKGKKEPNNIKTEVKIVYDDEAIYFGAYLYDDNPDEIPMEFQTRDNFGNADYFSVIINPSNDGINQTEFTVTSIGNQNDAKINSGYKDYSWNAVWESNVQLVENGWIVEIKIPYSALRFTNDKEQIWSVNFHRYHRKTREDYSWNLIDIENGKVGQYDGIITGISDIKPPVRLSFNPFIFGSTDIVNGQSDFNWSAGLDLKYGINENFTLDATLIPDFGQVAFDDVTLNLGPFEQIYSEQRSFFTEGTDLFSKGDLFNSRRIGGLPSNFYQAYSEINSNEEIENPTKVDVLNIIKVSGRTKKGLGIGVLNAITKKTEAIYTNTNTHQSRKVVTEPLTNYNVLVLDQQFNKNSSISFVNTNVIRNGDFRDANVSSVLFNINKKDNSYGFSGNISNSNVLENGENKSGLQGSFSIGKKSGKNKVSLGVRFMDNKYDKNDLGYMNRNNYLRIYSNYSYNMYKPKGIFNRYGIYSWASVGYRLKLDENSPAYAEYHKKYTGSNFGMSFWGQTKKHWSFGGNFNTGIGKNYDYYEPRVPERFYASNSNFNSNFWFSSDHSKKLAFNFNLYTGFTYGGPNKWIGFGINPKYRINDKFSISYGFDYGVDTGELGFVTVDNSDNIIFGKRDTYDIENTLSGTYNFNTKTSLALSFRHFWSPVTYSNQYYLLKNNGELEDNTYSETNNINFNTWNVDLNFKWEFAPGSEMIALYRNNIFSQNNQSQLNFTDNLNNLFNEDFNHNISLKLVYYLDYNKAKNWF